MKWITRENVKVDRVACPWLIQKFIDPEAKLLSCRAIPIGIRIAMGLVYDVPNCELGHRGEDISFNSMAKKYESNRSGPRTSGRNCAGC